MYKLFNGDCLEVMKDIPDKSVDMILCDLPYGTTACKWDVIIPFELLWEQYNRIIKDNAAIVLFGSQPFTTKLIASNYKLFRYDLVWDKKKGCDILMANKKPLKSHENILIFYKKLPTYNKQYWYSTPYKRINGNKKHNGIYGNVGSASCESIDGRRNPLSILSFSRDGKRIHPTQKPVALLEYLIKTYTNENELILDNCMGSGSTGVAALNTNRRFIGIEKEDKYYEIAKKRIEDVSNSKV